MSDEQLPAKPERNGLLSAIVQMARDPTMDVTKLTALIAEQERLEARQAEREYGAALAAFATEMPQVERRGTVTLGRSGGGYKFAKWEDMDTVLRPLMGRHGFVLSFTSSYPDATHLTLTGRLRHTAGHSEFAEITLPVEHNAPGRNAIQSVASTVTSAKRYVAEMLLNIVRKDAATDDDGRLGGTKFLNAEQIAEIEQLIVDTKTDRENFLERFFESTDVGNLTLDQFVPAKNMLLARQRARQPGE